MNIPLLFALNVGTAAMLVLGAATIVIQQKHFSTHGKEAMLIAASFILVAALLRFVSVNAPELLSNDINRIANGWFALVLAARQVVLLVEAHFEQVAMAHKACGRNLIDCL